MPPSRRDFLQQTATTATVAAIGPIASTAESVRAAEGTSPAPSIDAGRIGARPVSSSRVRVLGGPLKRAQDISAKYLLELEDHATLGGAGPKLLDASRRFRDALKAKAYDVTYTEVPGANHAPRWWKTRLADGIVLLSAGWSSR